MKIINLLFGITLLNGLTVYSQIPTTGLIGYYPFNGNANDASGKSLNGTVNGAMLTIDRFNNTNQAYSFDGTNDYLEIPNSDTLNFGTSKSFTYSIWSKYYGTQTYAAGLIGKETFVPASSGQGCQLMLINDQARLDWMTDSPTALSLQGIKKLNDSIWHLVVLTVNRNTNEIKIYIDAALDATLTDTKVSSANLSNTATMKIGVERSMGVFYNGKIDDIRIYNRALSTTEISQLYNESICKTLITVTDTLIINANITNYNPLAYRNTFKVYPNPTNDHIIIDNGDYSQISNYTIKIINATGTVVFSHLVNQSSFNIDLNSFTGKGNYFLQLIDDKSNVLEIKKVILQ